MKQYWSWMAVAGAACLGAALSTVAVRAVEPAQVTAALEQARQWQPGHDYAAFRTLEELARQTKPGDPARKILATGLVDLARSDAAYEVRRRACRLLWVVGDETTLPPLLEMVTDPQQVELACYALRSHPSGAVDAGLVQQLPKLQGSSLVAVVNLLGDRRAAAAVPALGTLAGGGDPAVAKAAWAALGRIGSIEAGRLLWQRWNASGPQHAPALRDACAECAQRLETVRPRLARRFYEAFWHQRAEGHTRLIGFLGLVRLGGPQAMGLISETMADPDERLAQTAIAATGDLPGNNVAAVFLRRLPDLSVPRQAALLRMLARRDEPQVLKAARRLMQEAEAQPVRLAAIEVVGQKGDASDVPALVGLLHGTEREAALAALRRVPGPDVRAALLELAAQGEWLEDAGFVELLAQRHVNGAAALLVRRLREPPHENAAVLLKALGTLADPALVPAILDACPPSAVEPAIECALQIWRRNGQTEHAARLVWERYAVEANPQWRRGLLHAATALGGSGGWRPLTAALHDADPGVRAAAVRALAEWPSPEVLPVLLALADNQEEKTAVIALRGALRLLDQTPEMPPADRLAGYRRAMELARRPEERRLALAGLGSSGLPGAVDLIAPWLDQPDLKAEALHALLQLAAKQPQDHADKLRRVFEGVEVQDPALRQQVQEALKRLRRESDGENGR